MFTKNSSISLFVSCLIWLIRSHENKCRYKTREKENFSKYSIKFVVIRWDIRCWYRCRLQLTTWWKLSSACVCVTNSIFHNSTVRVLVSLSYQHRGEWENFKLMRQPELNFVVIVKLEMLIRTCEGVRRALQKHTKKARYEDEISVQFSNYIFCI